MFAKLKEKTPTIGAQRSPSASSAAEKSKSRATSDDMHRMHESSLTSPDFIQQSHQLGEGISTLPVPGKLSRQSSISSLVSDMSMMSTSQFVNDSPMPNIDGDLGTFDVEDSALPVLSTDLSSQDIYSGLVRESRQKLNLAKFKYQDLLTAYRELEKQNARMKDGLAKSQDRAFKKIAELKEREKMVRTELNKCQERVAELDQEKAKFVSAEELEGNIRKSRIAEMEATITEYKKHVAESKESQDRLSSIVSTLQAEKKCAEEGLKLASDKVVELKKQVTEKEAIHSLALAECKRTFHSLLEERDAELKNCRHQLDATRKEMNSSKESTETMNSIINLLKAEKLSLETASQEAEKRMEAEKMELLQEISKAKTAACDAMQVDFENKAEDIRRECALEFDKRLKASDVAWQQRLNDSQEQSKLALEESWMSRNAALSKCEEELEGAQMRISQLSVELDATRMNLHRRTLEAEQLKTAHDQMVLQSTADIEQAVSQCRRDLEKSHRERIKHLHEDFEQKMSKANEGEATVNNGEKEPAIDCDALWSRVEVAIKGADKPKSIHSVDDIVDFLINNCNQLSTFAADIERTMHADAKIAAAETERVRTELNQELSSLKEQLLGKADEILKLTSLCDQLKCQVDEIEPLRKNNAILQQTVSEKNGRTGNLEKELEQLRSKLDSTEKSHQQNSEKMQLELSNKARQIESLESQLHQNSELSKAGSDEVQTLQNDITVLRQQIQSKDAEIQKLEGAIGEMKLKIAELESHALLRADLQKQLDMKSAELQSSSYQNDKTKSDMAALAAEMENARKKLATVFSPSSSDDSLVIIVEQALREYTAVKTKFENNEKENAACSKSLSAAQSQLTQLEKDYQQAVTENKQKVASLTEELARCQAELEKETLKMEELKSSSLSKENDKTSQIHQLEQSMQQLSNEKQSVQQHLAAAHRDLEREKQQLQSTTADYHKQRDEMKALREQHEFVLVEVAQREKHLTDDSNRLGQELQESAIEIRRLETKISVLEAEVDEAKSATKVSVDQHEQELVDASKKADELTAKCATLEMDIVDCREKMSLSQELVGKLKSELDTSRKATEESQNKYAALKSQSARKLKVFGDEKCELEKQLANSYSEVDSLKFRLATNDSAQSDPNAPDVNELQNKVSDLTGRVDTATKVLAEKEMRVAELELELSDRKTQHESELKSLASDKDRKFEEAEQRFRFEMKRIASEFERQLAEREKQMAKFNESSTTRDSRNSGDSERQVRHLERELSEKNAAVEQLVVMYEKQLRDQAAELQQETTDRLQSQSAKHQAEVDGLMEEFRNETKQWMVERQNNSDEMEQCRRDRDQMVHELKRLSDLLDSARSGGQASPSRLSLHERFESSFLTPSSAAQQSSVLAGSSSPTHLNTGPTSLQLHEATEYEYLRNILLEYMLGRETNVLWRVIATVMRFSEEQMVEIGAREEERQNKWL